MALPYFHVDAFTGRKFAGNPAGVCPLVDWLPTETLQSMAAEHKLAETAFFVHHEGTYELRWFTPSVEVDLCGHATLASAHVLFEHLGLSESVVKFQTRSGLLSVHRDGDLLTLDFPSWPPKPCDAPMGFVEALGSDADLRRQIARLFRRLQVGERSAFAESQYGPSRPT